MVRTHGTMATPSSSRRTAPASKREISSRSSTSWVKRAMSLPNSSRACWERSGIWSWLFDSTWMAALIVVNGERSSWLTSLANRASRSMRSCRLATIELKFVTRGARSESWTYSS